MQRKVAADMGCASGPIHDMARVNKLYVNIGERWSPIWFIQRNTHKALRHGLNH